LTSSAHGFAHHALLQNACEAQGSFDVGDLCAFITAGQQNDHLAPTLCVRASRMLKKSASFSKVKAQVEAESEKSGLCSTLTVTSAYLI